MELENKKVISLSPSTLDLIQSCMRAYSYSKIKKLQPRRKDSALDFGGLFHKIVHPYYFGRIPPEFQKEHHFTHPYSKLIGLNYRQLVEACVEIGRRYSLLTDLEIEERNECLELFAEYATFYANDGWRTLEVEQPFTVNLYEDDSIIIVFRGVMDLFVDIPSRGSVPVDHKTGSRDSVNSLLRNQFIGSSFVFGTNQFIENKVLRVKNEKFRREAHYYDDDQKLEWYDTAVFWGKQLAHYIEHDFYPMNNSSCRFCNYRKLCETPPSARENRELLLYHVSNYDHDIYAPDPNLIIVINQVLGKSNDKETQSS
jgi:hypothetical protein